MSGLGVALVVWLVGSIPVALVVGFTIRRSDRGRRRHPAAVAARDATRRAGDTTIGDTTTVDIREAETFDLAAIERSETARTETGRRDPRPAGPAPTTESGDGDSARLRR